MGHVKSTWILLIHNSILILKMHKSTAVVSWAPQLAVMFMRHNLTGVNVRK